MPEYCITTEARKIMINRANAVYATVDFNRPYRDIVKKRSWWVMEDWLHWSETWSRIILQPYLSVSRHTTHILHHSEIRVMWQALRTVVSHFMRPDEDDASTEACSSTKEALHTYSTLVEQVFGHKGCTPNLHMVVCRYMHFCFYMYLYI